MGKGEKRKTRLNKGGGGEFIGFGAFSSEPAIVAAPLSTGSSNSSSSPLSPVAQSLSLTPVYAGKDSTLSHLFPRIGQKRDATTKTKALQELTEYFENAHNPGKTDDNETSSVIIPTKKTLAEALCHFLYLYHSKLCYDTNSSVRVAAIACLQQVHSLVPKAWKTLTTEQQPELLGIIFCAQADPSAQEVRTAATTLCQSLLPPNPTGNLTPDMQEQLLSFNKGIWLYAQRILSYGRPTILHDALFARHKSKKDSNSPNPKDDGKKSKSASSSSNSALSEDQVDQMEERYERIVGAVIEGLQIWIHRYFSVNVDGGLGEADIPYEEIIRSVLKNVSSPRGSLRRKTYAFVTVCCQKQQQTQSEEDSKVTLVDTQKVGALLAQSLSSEKESTNQSSMLEAVLAFLAFLPKQSRYQTFRTMFSKPISKLLKRFCHGAPASQWAPTLLPIIAMIGSGGEGAEDTIELQLSLLTSVSEGTSNVTADKLEVVAAVAESTAFVLLKQASMSPPKTTTNASSLPSSEEGEPEDSGGSVKSEASETIMAVAQHWLDAVGVYLSTVPSGAAQRVYQRLGKGLARDLIQLDQASKDKNSVMYHIRDWFWGKQGIYVGLLADADAKNSSTNSVDKNLALWLKEISGRLQEQYRKQQTPSDGGQSDREERSYQPSNSLSNVLRDKFHSQLRTFQGASGLVPPEDTYLLWIAIFKLIGVDQVFTPGSREAVEPSSEMANSTTSADKFIMNDVLRWMIIHSSTLSDYVNMTLTRLDFTLYQLCQTATTRQTQWGSIIRELVAAKCDLGMLRAGLLVILESGENIEDLRCEAMDVLAIQIAEEFVSNVAIEHDEDSEDIAAIAEEYRKVASFLGLCVGFETEGPGMLVGEEVISSWVDFACPAKHDLQLEDYSHSTGANPVLETLVCLIRTHRESLSEDQIQRVLLESWRRGGDLWRDSSRQLVQHDDLICSKIVNLASSESKAIFVDVVHDQSESKEAEEAAHVWSSRALRLLEVCGDDQEGVPKPSLTLVGLGDLQCWRNWYGGSNGWHLASYCLLELVEQLDNEEDRVQLFEKSEGVETSELVVAILMSLSGASSNTLSSESARRRNDACAKLLSAFGGQGIAHDLVDRWCRKVVEILETAIQSSEEQLLVRGISVLSQLVQLMFARITTSDSRRGDEVDPNDVKEGDILFYIPAMENTSSREQVRIVKVHRDMPAELYFTVKLFERGDQEPERQTVAERLRKEASSPAGFARSIEDRAETRFISVGDIPADEVEKRDSLSQLILQKVVLPFSTTWTGTTAEVMNILICQSGVGRDRGIGSLHYDIFRLLSTTQTQLKGLLDSDDNNSEQVAAASWKLALALGFGCNTPTSTCGLKLLGFNPTDSISSIVEHYNASRSDSTTEFDAAIAAWLVVSVGSLEDSELRNQALSLLFRLSARLLGSNGEGFGLTDFLALRAIHAAQQESHHVPSGESIVQEDEADALSGLVKAFASKWKEEEGGESSVWNSSPFFRSIVDASCVHRPALIGAACRRCSNDLAGSISSDIKRCYCLRFLSCYAAAGIPLHEDVESSMNAATSDRVRKWSEGLSSEEAEELECDASVAAQWLPGQLMNEIESWGDAVEENIHVDDNISVGRMVTWLALLRIVDEAATKDSVNRPSLASYVNKCGAVDIILNTTLSYANIGNDRKVKTDRVIDTEELWTEEGVTELSKIAELVIFRTVEVFPAPAKHWWEMQCPKYFTQPVSDFVEMRVGPEILRRELERIKQTSSFGNMTVTGSTVSRECVARYVQDDFTLTVVIRLPPSFPFRSAEVDCSKTLGVPEKRWKRWSLQITLMLNNESGKVGDALMLWKENVDKEFEGVEPCPVCYSVLHVKTHKLPELECKTCHNRFHFDCLTQWFRSSGKSACVLCQQPWSGTRVN